MILRIYNASRNFIQYIFGGAPYILTTKTLSGTSRIFATTPQTQAGVSRIQNTTLQTQVGVSRIKGTSTQTLSGTCRIAIHLNTAAALLSADTFPQNRLTTYVGAMPEWVIHVPTTAQYFRIDIQNTISIQLGVSGFTNTLTGTTPSGTVTFEASTMSFSSYQVRSAIALILGSVNNAAIEMDGLTSIAIAGSQISQPNITMDGVGSWVMNASKSWAGLVDMDGTTDVAIDSLRIVYGSWEADGATDVEITTIGVFDTSMEMDGNTDMEVTVFRQVNGPWNADGTTDVQIDTIIAWAGNLTMDGQTDIAIDSRQTYTFGNLFTMDGRTNFSMLVSQSYAAFLQIAGTTDVVVANTIATLSGNIECDGATAFTMDSVADYFVHLDMDGVTDVDFGAFYIPIIQIVSTGVGDMFIQAAAPYQTDLFIDGTTDCQSTAILNASALFQVFTGLQTDVHITAGKIVTVFLNMDGSASVFIVVAQDLFGNVIFDQIDQELLALGSYIFSDGSMFPTANTTFNPVGTLIAEAPDYIWGIINTQTGIGSPDFVPIGIMNFTTDGKTARTGDSPDWQGFYNHKYAFGFNREVKNLYDKPSSDNTKTEWVRFNFFVSNAIDLTQIPDSIGFTAMGISALGGDGIVGRDEEKYVTFAVLTHGLMTQETMEVLAAGNPNCRTTQFNYEMLWTPGSYGRMTQLAEEVLYLANLAVIQQTAVEALANADTGSRHGVVQQTAVEALSSIKATAFVTQTSIEGFQGPGDPNVNLTEVSVEILTFAQEFFNATAVIQQSAVETIHNAIPPVSVNQALLETAHNGDPKGRVNQTAVEVLHDNSPNCIFQQVSVEELGNSTGGAGTVQQVAIEMLVRPEYDPTVSSFVNNPHYVV